MKLSAYLLDRLFSCIVYICAMLLSAGLLWLIDVRTVFILFFEALFCGAFSAGLIWDYYRKKRYYKVLWDTFDGLDDKTLLAELMEYPDFLDGHMLYQVVHHTDKYMNDCLSKTEREIMEYREYVEMWVHEIKTPITSAHLMVENDKNRTTLRIDNELQNIDHFVEQALYYARSTSLEKDFKVEMIALKELVNSALKKYSKLVIQAKGHLQFENLDSTVLADRKWCTFLIGQVIANAVKYRKDDFVLNFSGGQYEDGEYLLVTDNGIGIPAADLPLVFDKGFTGLRGREYTKSTGIGLYLCQKLCHKMNMKVSIESEEGKGTTVKFTFPKQDIFMEQV